MAPLGYEELHELVTLCQVRSTEDELTEWLTLQGVDPDSLLRFADDAAGAFVHLLAEKLGEGADAKDVIASFFLSSFELGLAVGEHRSKIVI